MHSKLTAREIKAFVPAQDYVKSKAFYRDVGFEMASDMGDVAYFRLGECSFLLQDFLSVLFCLLTKSLRF